MNENRLKLLNDIARKCKAERSPHVPVAYFKHHSNYRENLKTLRKDGLVFLYKGEAIGLSKKGLEAIEARRKKEPWA